MNEGNNTGISGYVSSKVGDISAHSKQAGLGLALQVMGVIPLMIAAIIGLGELMGDRYALSALIVAVVLLGAGFIVERRAMSQLRSRDLTLSPSPNFQQGAIDPEMLKRPAAIGGGLLLMMLGRYMKRRANAR